MRQLPKWLIFSLTLTCLIGCNTMSKKQQERAKRINASPQFQDGLFVNPNGVAAKLFSQETWDTSKEYIFGTRIDAKPDAELPVNNLIPEQWNQSDELAFAWLGHSSMLISMEGLLVLVDPVLDERASPFSWIGPKRIHPTPIKAEQLTHIDVVLITHDHYDHLEKSTMITLKDQVDHFIVPLGIGELLEDWGIVDSKITELDWWESFPVGSLSFHATPAVHYASRGLFDGNKRLWCSWSIIGARKRLFISGDSGYFNAFSTIGKRLGPFDMTFLKIGAYSDTGTWRAMHMTPEEAGQQHLDLRGKTLIPTHWATFDLGLHPWYEPIERLMTFASENNISVLTPEIGKRIDLNAQITIDTWWATHKNVHK